jgi:L-ascorbate metabolism protein UlaG (beta-lactamase superfamily)
MLFAAPKYRGPESDHFDGRRFLNLQPTRHAGFLDMMRWLLNRDHGPWDRWREITPSVPPARSDALRVTWVNHSTFLIQVANVNILTDPIWSERCSPVQWAGPKRRHAPGIRFESLPPIDTVLISHNHYDHLDVGTLRRLQRRQTFVGLGNSAFLRGATDLDWWESAAISDAVRVTCVPAQHFSSRGVTDRDANLWCGFVLETPQGPLYFAGDTGWGPQFAMIRERFGPMRLALLPIGAYRPEWFMCSVHISPRDAVRAAEVLEAQVSIPMHYYTFDLGDDGQDEPVHVLRSSLGAGSPHFEILRPGESFTTGTPMKNSPLSPLAGRGSG